MMKNILMIIALMIMGITGCTAPDIDEGPEKTLHFESPTEVEEDNGPVQLELKISPDFTTEEVGSIIQAADQWDSKIDGIVIVASIEHNEPNVHRSLEKLPGDTGDFETSRILGMVNDEDHIVLYVDVIEKDVTDIFWVASHEIGHWLGHPHHNDSALMNKAPTDKYVTHEDVERLCTEYRNDCGKVVYNE